MHTADEIMRRLESGLTTIAIELGRLHQAKTDKAEPSEVRLAINVIDTEMQRMHFFLTELKDAEQRGYVI